MRIRNAAFALILAAILMANGASASLDCNAYLPGSSHPGVNIFNLSVDSANIGPACPEGREVWCRDTDGWVLDSSGTGAYNATIIRVTMLQGGHAERGDFSNYPFMLNLSSNDVRFSCAYLADCGAYDTCVVSLNDETNAHTGNCSQYDLKACCSSIDITLPVCEMDPLPEWVKGPFEVSWNCTDPAGIDAYNVQRKVTWSSGLLVSDWAPWLSDVGYTSAEFTPAANNQTYYFRVNATDKNGNIGYWSAPASTTFDNESPVIASSGSNDGVSHKFTVHSAAWDNVSGISKHTINCTITNPEGSKNVDCPEADRFGGISSCSTEPIGYNEHTVITCALKAKDRAGNEKTREIYFSPGTEHPLAEFLEHAVFISMGDIHHARIYVRNLNSSWDEVTVSLEGTYPDGLAKFVDSPLATRTSDGKNVTVPLDAYEQKTLYVGITSTDAGDYTLGLMAKSKNFPLTDSDEMKITVGFSTAFPGIGAASILMLVALSAFAYWKIRKG